MRIIQTVEQGSAKKTSVLEIEDSDIISIQYNSFEEELIQECTKSNSIADKLLMLEMIARKIELTSKLRSKDNEKE